jgi:hypothetical protein
LIKSSALSRAQDPLSLRDEGSARVPTQDKVVEIGQHLLNQAFVAEAIDDHSERHGVDPAFSAP